MFRQLRIIVVSFLQTLIPPPSLPNMKYYTFPDHDRRPILENYKFDKAHIKAEKIYYKNSPPILE